MKKKSLILVSIMLIIMIIGICFKNYNNDNTFMIDGVLFAMTLDGEEIREFPSSNVDYTADIDCTNGVGKWLPVKSGSDYVYKFVLEDITGNVVCKIDFYTKTDNDLIKNVVNNSDVIINEGIAGYRYEGTDPNNYVWFNNELWRIIGNIPVCLTSSCGDSTTSLVKIIRESSIGVIAYDGRSSGFIGRWGRNSLHILLNQYYYGAIDGTNAGDDSRKYCSGYKDSVLSKCDYRAIGIKENTFYGNMIQEVYWNSGDAPNSATPSSAYDHEKDLQRYIGRVGIMSLSDYGYATSSLHDKAISSYNNDVYKSTNWLFSQGAEWLNTLNEGSAGYTLRIQDDGSVDKNYSYFGGSVRPVVYLKSSVYVSSGDGTITNPYILGM